MAELRENQRRACHGDPLEGPPYPVIVTIRDNDNYFSLEFGV